MNDVAPLQVSTEDPPEGDESWLWYRPHSSRDSDWEGFWRQMRCSNIKCDVQWLILVNTETPKRIRCWACGRFQRRWFKTP